MNVVLCPDSTRDLSSTAARARDAGFGAIELTADDRAESPSVTNLLWSSAKSFQQKLGDLSVVSVRSPGDWSTIRRAIAAAASVGCGLVRVVGVDLSPAKKITKPPARPAISPPPRALSWRSKYRIGITA